MAHNIPHPVYPNCFSPIRLGGVSIANRVFVPGHTTNYGADHLPSPRHVAYHRARAKGGAGLIIFESIRVARQSLGRPQAVGGFTKECIEPFRALTDAVHAEGVPIFGQVLHLGRQVPGEFERTVGWGPSPIRWSATAAMPHAMHLDDMREVIDAHVVTARHLVEAGFDGLEVHLGHGHLLQQFLSPSSNQRDDNYGGSEANRRRFPLEVLRAIRDAVGPQMCVGVRVSGEEFINDGLHLDEMCRQLVAIAQQVPIDFANTSHSAYHGSYSLATQMADMGMDTATFRHIPGAFRRSLSDARLNIPVLSVCRYVDLEEAETMLAAQEADMIGLARAHMADAELVNKSRAGRKADIRPCIGCNQGCAGHLQKDLAITCLTNPRMGLEGKWPEPENAPTSAPAHVLVIGGGPAGLEAAWVAAARGHQVTLWEQSSQLGGQLNALSGLHKREEFLGLLTYQTHQCTTHGVAIALGQVAIPDSVESLAPDAVILATGSDPVPMELPMGGQSLTLDEALEDPDRLGQRVAVYDTIGEWSALGAIEHWTEQGKSVAVFSPVPAFSWRTTIYSTYANSIRLRERQVKIALMRRILGFGNDGLHIEDTSTGERETVSGFDSLVAIQYNVSRDHLYGSLRKLQIPLHLVGDALSPRTALEAVFEGHEIAMAL